MPKQQQPYAGVTVGTDDNAISPVLIIGISSCGVQARLKRPYGYGVAGEERRKR